MLDKIKLLHCEQTEREFFLFVKSQIGCSPNNLKFYKEAITHKSAFTKDSNGNIICNERLEYLGDTVLDTIISKYLFEKYPDQNEGFLTKMRSKIVNRKSLNQIGNEIKLDKYIISNALYTDSVNAVGNALEAFIGAIFMDLGFAATQNYVINQLLHHIDFNFLETVDTNFKSRLIEVMQRSHGTISFNTVELEHDEKTPPSFHSTITINECNFCDGEGKTKKEAEQKAAQKALEQFQKSNN